MQKIALHSAPRSGSTWLGNLLDSHPAVIFKFQPLFSYAFKGRLKTDSTVDQIDDFFNELTYTKGSFIDQLQGKSQGTIPTFKKCVKATHIIYKEVRYHHILENMAAASSDIKFVFLIRNPLAVLYSWKNAPKEFRASEGWNFMNEWRFASSKNLDLPEEFNGYEKWKESAGIFLKLKRLYPENVKLVNYSDLIENTMATVKEVFEFAGLDFGAQTERFIQESRAKNQDDAYSVYKTRQQDKDWLQLPESVIDFVQQDLSDSPLKIYL